MKKILIVAAVLLGIGFSNQWAVMRDYKGTEIWRKAYTASTLDTTQWIATGNYEAIYLALASEDSASIHVYYQLGISTDTVMGAQTLYDSLSTGNNAGDVKVMNLTTVCAAAPYVRFVFDGQVFRLGVTSAKYTASYMLKE
jgi:hypothetical protein